MFAATMNNDSKNEQTTTFTRQGSLRRVIPPEIEKEHLFGRQNEDLNKIFKIYRQEYIILAEYKMIQTEDIQGVYVIPSRENPLVWFGVLFVRNGPYKDGIFRFTIMLDESYPDCQHPKIIFNSKLLHPVINCETNELSLIGGFPTWHKSKQHLWQVLKYIQWIFANIEASIPHGVNKEACEMITSNPDAFQTKAQELVQLSKERIYDKPATDDKHYIIFEEFNSDLHKKDKLIAFVQDKDENGKVGYSWVLPRSFKPLERPCTPEMTLM